MATAVDLRKPDVRTRKPDGAAKGSRKGNLSPIKRIMLLVKVIMRRKGVQHLMRAASRFGERLGSQFAAAITYFSFLALVPILMVSFSVAGFVLNSNHDLLVKLQKQITAQIPGQLSDTISSALDQAINSRYSVLSIGLVVALYSGIGWMGNVRAAVQAQWRPDFDDNQEIAGDSFLKNLFRNLWMLAGLGLALVISLALSYIGNLLATEVLKLVGLGDVTWLKPVIVVVSLLLAVAADVLIFLWVYSVLPPASMKVPRKALVRGAIFAAVGFELLKFLLTNVLSKVISGGSSAAVFGPVIGLLAFFNLVATLVLFVAAWISTSDGGPTKAEAAETDELEVYAPAVVVRDTVSRPKLAGLLGVGALLGVGWSRRRR